MRTRSAHAPAQARAGRTLLARLLLACTFLCAPLAHAANLQVGDVAPDFALQGTDGKLHRLSDYRGKAVVVAWFPRAFTSGCTVECKSLAANGGKLRQFAVTYFMASVDPLADNRRFAASENADFPLLSDPDKHVAAAYGVLNPGGVASRQTFYIGADGKVLAIDTAVRPATSAEDMLSRLQALGVPRRH